MPIFVATPDVSPVIHELDPAIYRRERYPVTADRVTVETRGVCVCLHWRWARFHDGMAVGVPHRFGSINGIPREFRRA